MNEYNQSIIDPDWLYSKQQYTPGIAVLHCVRLVNVQTDSIEFRVPAHDTAWHDTQPKRARHYKHHMYGLGGFVGGNLGLVSRRVAHITHHTPQ